LSWSFLFINDSLASLFATVRHFLPSLSAACKVRAYHSRWTSEHSLQSRLMCVYSFTFYWLLFKIIIFIAFCKKSHPGNWAEWMSLKLIFKRWKKFLRGRQIFSPKLKWQQQIFFYSRECFEHTERSNIEFWHQNYIFKFVSFKFGGKRLKNILVTEQNEWF